MRTFVGAIISCGSMAHEHTKRKENYCDSNRCTPTDLVRLLNQRQTDPLRRMLVTALVPLLNQGVVMQGVGVGGGGGGGGGGGVEGGRGRCYVLPALAQSMALGKLEGKRISLWLHWQSAPGWGRLGENGTCPACFRFHVRLNNTNRHTKKKKTREKKTCERVAIALSCVALPV